MYLCSKICVHSLGCVKSMDDFDACVLGKFPCLIKGKLLKRYEKTLDKNSQKCEEAVK